MNTLTINAKLPSLNDYIDVCRRNKYQAAQFKRNIDELIGWAIKQALVKGTLHPIESPCFIEIEWWESSKRRDVDNVHSSVKFILDSLVKNQVIKNDSPKYVEQIYHKVYYGKQNKVIVRLIDCDCAI